MASLVTGFASWMCIERLPESCCTSACVQRSLTPASLYGQSMYGQDSLVSRACVQESHAESYAVSHTESHTEFNVTLKTPWSAARIEIVLGATLATRFDMSEAPNSVCSKEVERDAALAQRNHNTTSVL